MPSDSTIDGECTATVAPWAVAALPGGSMQVVPATRPKKGRPAVKKKRARLLEPATHTLLGASEAVHECRGRKAASAHHNSPTFHPQLAPASRQPRLHRHFRSSKASFPHTHPVCTAPLSRSSVRIASTHAEGIALAPPSHFLLRLAQLRPAPFGSCASASANPRPCVESCHPP